MAVTKSEQLTNDKIGEAVQSWLWLQVELLIAQFVKALE